MSNAHILQVPKAAQRLKGTQVVLSIFTIAFSAVVTAHDANHGSNFSIFTALYTILTIVYFFVSVRVATVLYNWVALLVLECLAVIFWLCTWAALVAAYVATSDSDDNASAVSGFLMGSIFLGVLEFIFFCITLANLVIEIRSHRKAGKPMKACDSYRSNGPWLDAGNEEMHNTQATQNYPHAPAPQAYSPNTFAVPTYPPAEHITYAQPTPVATSYAESPALASSQDPVTGPNANKSYGSNGYA